MNKKAALNLGISTVVVMVIAMVVIGSGVSFIRTFFDAGTGSLIGTIENVGEIGLNPDRNTPLVLETRNIRIAPTDSRSFRAGFYNRDTNPKDVKIDLGACTPVNISDTTRTQYCSNSESMNCGNLSIQSVETTVEGGNSVGFVFLLETSSVRTSTFVCSLRVVETISGVTTSLASQQITLDVRT